MKMELPFPVLHSLFMLNEAGYEAYVVGGSVRDALMGAKASDWDITTSAMPDETLAVFREYRTIETGIKHGTVTVIIDDTPLEITTYRVDGNYSDGRHPDTVAFSRSLTEDLKRRDFTVNAMAYHPEIGLIDPFGGHQDLEKRIVRCVGNPKERFSEDALRIVRCLRFSSTLGFTIHPETANEIHRLGHTLTYVSAERNAVEFCKLLCGKNVDNILSNYADALSYILPNVDFAQTSARISAVRSTVAARLAALLFNRSAETVRKACRRLCLSNHIAKDVTTIVEYRQMPIVPTRSGVLHTLHALGPQLTNTLLHLKTILDDIDCAEFEAERNRLIADNDLCYRLQDLAVTGTDLIESGIPRGVDIGLTLNRLLCAVMDGDCPNEKEKLLELATKKPVQ